MLGGIRILCRGGIGYPCRCGARRGGLNPRGTGYPCRCGARRGTEPRRHWLSLPLWCPQGAEPARHWLSLPLWCPQGAEPARHWLSLPLWCPQGGVPRRCRFGGRWRHPAGGLPSLSPAAPAFSLFSFPLSPRPPSPAGKGEFFCFFMQGASPLASPAFNRLRHLQSLPSRYSAQREVHGLPPEWQEMLSLEQCRQPRRGGTGGEELRRLRWSSPPGQSEPVPPGFSPLRVRQRQGRRATKKASPPPGAANARRAGNAGGKPPFGTTTPPPPIKNLRKVLGGSGDSFKSPPEHLSLPPNNSCH